MSLFNPRMLPDAEAMIGGGKPRRGRASGSLPIGKSVSVASSGNLAAQPTLEVVNASSLDDIVDDITLELWFKMTEPTVQYDVKDLLAKVSTAATKHFQIYISTNSSLSVQYRTENNSRTNGVGFGSGAFVEDEWYHVAVVRSRADSQWRFYRNGGDEKTDTNSNADDPFTFDSGGKLRIGKKDLQAGTEFTGLFAEVRIWDYARSAQEIADNYQRTLSGNEAGLRGYWRFLDNYLDDSADENHMTENQPGPAITADHPF